ncbi:right-handed parallel beta-helix repeat-containing protein [Microbacterium gilvum]|uniref:right-handed parallel beta-helix repeat-containing protein n=1 Tax=Microbacterium gilvum TaxID=1336204 RepID=UPI0031F01D1E
MSAGVGRRGFVGGVAGTAAGFMFGQAPQAPFTVAPMSIPELTDWENHRGLALVDRYPSSDSWDSSRIANAIEDALTRGLGGVLFSARDYDLNVPVVIPPVDGFILQGIRGQTRFTRTANGVTGTAFRMAPPIGTTIKNIVFDGLTFWGGMTNIADLGTRRARRSGSGATESEGGAEIVFSDARLRAAISCEGDLAKYWNSAGDDVPNQYGVTRDVYVRNCEFVGLQGLPVFFRGARGVSSVESSRFQRCLDPGWVYCEDARFEHNLSEYSMDNGCSLSRGCVNVRAVGNTIIAPWFNGIWVGGFRQDPPTGSTPSPKPTFGPRNVVVESNTITRAGEYGIYGRDSYGRFVLVGNNILDTIPPEGTGATRGAGIVIDAWSADEMPLSVTINGNTIDGVARSCIDVRNARSVTISGNTLRTVGSKTNPDGTIRPGQATQRVGVYVGGLNALTVVAVVGNTIADQRGAASAMFFGISIPAGAGARVVEGNAVFGAENGNNLP